jgi:hypothetical protein
MLILVVLVVVFASCASPADEPDVVGSVNPFEGRWLVTNFNVIVEYRGKTIISPSGELFRFDYDNYYYEWMNGNMSHIVTTWTYEFRDNGNELHLIFVEEKNYYGVIPSSKHDILQKTGD